ncbi:MULTISPECIES: hypothetical protein [Acinetobacter]|uniref:Uncharacterized protein n=1 Tax=Acinetobacter indicus TaxID=756892 RepID=A0A6C0Y6W7_9GAMM|nr:MULTISPECIES: hypothetical protein [Acinetobacter]QIC71843.1 hypothetical protein FSC09_15750 [Acinetobacter indicus]QKQ71379.1 hypothetical protein E5Y90_14200 [Acinetobacter sp. 10FS3-1]
MRLFTPKQLALRIQPELKSKRLGGVTKICLCDEVIAMASTPVGAWQLAYERLAAVQFKVGDLLVIVDCIEADLHKGKVWKCRHGSFKTQHGDYGAFLEGFSGYFLCAFLRKATPEEALTFQPQSNDAVA